MDQLSDMEAQELSSLDTISSIHKDDPIFHTSEQVQKDLPSWGLDRIDQREGGDDEFHFPSSAGEGVDVYLIDTGINIDHVDFGGRASYGPTFTTSSNKDPQDTNGHGTFVAGICCGNIYGVAKKANIISLKALDENGSGKLSNILLALHWVAKRHLSIPEAKSIVNLSLASQFHLPTNEAVEQVIKLGIHFSVAAGNHGKEACGFSPASAKDTLVVGAINPDDSIASYSNFGNCVDIYAPGTAITSVWHHHKKAVHILSGTSMAAPHVTGVMAILLSQKDYTPLELVKKVKESATSTISSRTPKDNDTLYEIAATNNSTEIKVLYMDTYNSSNSISNRLKSTKKQLLIIMLLTIYSLT